MAVGSGFSLSLRRLSSDHSIALIVQQDQKIGQTKERLLSFRSDEVDPQTAQNLHLKRTSGKGDLIALNAEKFTEGSGDEAAGWRVNVTGNGAGFKALLSKLLPYRQRLLHDGGTNEDWPTLTTFYMTRP